MSRELPKITFNDKADSWIRENDSKHILTAGNINEIKNVVNSLSEAIQDSVQFAEIYAELRIQVPDDLLNERQYDLEIQLAKDIDFSSEVISISYVQDPALFMTFKNGNWIALDKIDGNLTEKLIKVSIYDKIKDRGLLYFGRFRFNSISPALNGEWNGFCLGSYAEGNASSKTLTDLELVDENNVKISSMSTLERHSCRLCGKDPNGRIIELSDLTLSTGSTGIVVINGTQISIDQDLWQPKTAVISATGKHLGVDYSLKTEIYAYPMMLKKIDANFPTGGIAANVSRFNYTLTGVTYDDVRIANMQNEIEGSVFEAPWATIPSPGVLEIDREAQAESGKDQLLIFWSWHGRLVDFSIVKLITSRYDYLSETFSLDQSSVSSNPLSSVYAVTPNKVLAGATYDVDIKGRRGNVVETASGAELREELNAPGITLWKDDSGQWKIKAMINVDTPFILKASLNGRENRQIFIAETLKTSDIIVEQPASVLHDATSRFVVKRRYSDGTEVEDPDAVIEVAAGDLSLVTGISGQDVTFERITRSRESICLKARTSDGLEKLFIVIITRS